MTAGLAIGGGKETAATLELYLAAGKILFRQFPYTLVGPMLLV